LEAGSRMVQAIKAAASATISEIPIIFLPLIWKPLPEADLWSRDMSFAKDRSLHGSVEAASISPIRKALFILCDEARSLPVFRRSLED